VVGPTGGGGGGGQQQLPGLRFDQMEAGTGDPDHFPRGHRLPVQGQYEVLVHLESRRLHDGHLEHDPPGPVTSRSISAVTVRFIRSVSVTGPHGASGVLAWLFFTALGGYPVRDTPGSSAWTQVSPGGHDLDVDLLAEGGEPFEVVRVDEGPGE
jgi:hypothetical protein